MAEKIKLGSNGNFGVKEGGTLAFNDENNVFKAIELASSRASTGTYVAESGLIADAKVGVPRIDWTNGVGELLLEPQSTNLIPYSEDFTNVAWSKSVSGTGIAPVVTANQGLSPDGSVNADRVVFDLSGGTTASDLSQLFEGVTGTASIDYHLSVYIKSFDGSNYQLELSDVNGADKVLITVTSEWQRFDLSTNNATTVKGLNLRLKGDTTSQTADILIWGAQVEALSYPTSYIRTEGSQVTRIADAVTGNSSLGQVINSSEGVLYFEGSALADDGTTRRLGLSNGTSTTYFTFQYSNTSNVIRVLLINGGATEFDSGNITQTQTNLIKVAIKYKVNDFSVWVNGVEVYSDATGNTYTANTLNKFSFDQGVGTSPFYGRIRELKVYDTALTDAELTTLTTL